MSDNKGNQLHMDPTHVVRQSGFCLEMLFGGENSFCGERKCEQYPKKKKKFVIVWGGGNSKLRGGNFPPKGPKKKKNTADDTSLASAITTEGQMVVGGAVPRLNLDC